MADDLNTLIRQARKAAQTTGGLLAILLVIKRGRKVVWDPKRVRFVVDGKLIPISAVRKELARLDLKLAATIESYNRKLASGQWSIKKWRKEMDGLVQTSHILYGALALGGIAVALKDANVLRRTGRDLKAVAGWQYTIDNGLMKSLAMSNNRGRSYVRSFSVTYNILSQRMHILAGYDEAKRILTRAEHCRTKNGLEGCFEVAQRGWIPIREMPPIGTLPCKQWCKCSILYRKKKTR
jgi:hypothetical protein